MEKEMTKHIERETNNHFCTCDDLSCKLNPNNPINSTGNVHSCDPCIRKNLKAREIPSCFFLLVNEDMAGVEDFTIDGFVEFYLKNKQSDKVTSDKKED
jgi:hypothetical protein